MKEIEFGINRIYYKEEEKKLTIFQKSFEKEVDKPCFYYHENLSIAGNWRRCFVELNKSLKLVGFWVMSNLNGIQLDKRSLRVKKARESVLYCMIVLFIFKMYFVLEIGVNFYDRVVVKYVSKELEINSLLYIGGLRIVRRIWSKKKIMRFYSEATYKKDGVYDGYAKLHKHQAVTIMEAINNSSKELKIDSVIQEVETNNDFTFKVGIEKNVVKDLNSISKIEVEERMLALVSKKEIKKDNCVHLESIYKKFNVSNGLIMNPGEKVKVINITNLTRSPKNASNIIMKGEVEGQLAKGLHAYNDNSIYIFLMDKEAIIKAIFLLSLFYKRDSYNKVILERTGKQERMDLVIEENIKEKIKVFELEAVRFEKLWKEEKTVLDYLVESLKKKW